jgi:serine/threonine protein kinase
MEPKQVTDSFQLNHDPLTFATGQTFGKRYKIIEVIGHGGMGKVFKAYDNELDIVVALKMIKPSLIADENVIARFKRELLLAREIQHDNVIRIHDLGEIDQIKYISMNYINGNSLNEIIESVGQLSVPKTLDLANQICCALSAAHAKGIIHRDLKPQNIMIDKKGKLYVLDFGIARSLRQSSHTTEPGVVIGTPDIMSPEQIQGEKADERSDIYALGVIMFQMVTGELPFTAEDYNSLLYKHVNEPVPTADQFNPFTPVEFSKTIAKCMEKNPQDRFQSVDELVKKLNHLTSSQRQGQKKKKRKKQLESTPVTRSPLTKIKVFRATYRIIFVLLVIYGLISVLSLVTDAYYDVKVDQIKTEYTTYYKNLFPIKKEWQKQQPALKEANAWTLYAKVFPLQSVIGSPGNRGARETTRRYIKDLTSHPQRAKMKRAFSLEGVADFHDLADIVQSYGSNFRFKDLFSGGQFHLLNPVPLTTNGQTLNLELIKIYTEMNCVTARALIAAGSWQKALNRLKDYLQFCLDLYISSIPTSTAETALLGLQDTLQEILPILSLAKPAISTKAVFDVIPWIPWLAARPELLLANAIEFESRPAGAVVDEIESLLKMILEKLNPDELLYRHYLHLTHTYVNMDDLLGVSKTTYYYIKKILYWKHFFSRNKYFYQTGFNTYKKLLDGMQYIRNLHDKSIYISDFARVNKLSNNLLLSRIPHLSASLLLVRLQAKMSLAALKALKYGMDSPQWVEFSKTDYFTNDISGRKFKILPNSPGLTVFIAENLQIQLPIIDFPGGYIQSIARSSQYRQYFAENPLLSR